MPTWDEPLVPAFCAMRKSPGRISVQNKPIITIDRKHRSKKQEQQ
jgi:hypothetical protein